MPHLVGFDWSHEWLAFFTEGQPPNQIETNGRTGAKRSMAAAQEQS
jgi:hypothetical protein